MFMDEELKANGRRKKELYRKLSAIEIFEEG